MQVWYEQESFVVMGIYYLLNGTRGLGWWNLTTCNINLAAMQITSVLIDYCFCGVISPFLSVIIWTTNLCSVHTPAHARLSPPHMLITLLEVLPVLNPLQLPYLIWLTSVTLIAFMWSQLNLKEPGWWLVIIMIGEQRQYSRIALQFTPPRSLQSQHWL